ncbi:hypothetical protein Gasu2_19090 [Galdieria sulphuraria]|nr:hypothetical protein Gasu2_19090 [Galdieria sulphuraria]
MVEGSAIAILKKNKPLCSPYTYPNSLHLWITFHAIVLQPLATDITCKVYRIHSPYRQFLGLEVPCCRTANIRIKLVWSSICGSTVLE